MQWTEAGARVVSVSPGRTLTPMGRAELAANPLAMAAASATPLCRQAGRHRGGRRLPHLDSAGYITGCDLHVDGGTVAARLHRARLSS